MYKVFIDHKPVVFIEKNNLNENSPYIVGEDAHNIAEEMRNHLNDISIDQPLQILCENPEADFKRAFENFKWIEAAGGIVKRKDKFLMIKRNGLWDIPKGRIDKGESVENACVREIEEECGIYNMKIIESLTITHHLFKFKGKKAIKKTYWFMLAYDGSKETHPEIKEGITKAKWMTEEQMLAMREKSYGSISHVLDTYKDRYIHTLKDLSKR